MAEGDFWLSPSEQFPESRTVVITVPHATCSPITAQNRHPCDIAAPRAANALAQHFARRGLRTAVLRAEVPRATEDQNRSESRNSLFRREVDAKLERASLLLDVHSFPSDGSFGEGLEFVLLTTSLPTSNVFALESIVNGAQIVAELQKSGVSAKQLQGSPVNDLINTTISKGRLAFLLEFNESLSDERLEKIVAIVATKMEEIVAQL